MYVILIYTSCSIFQRLRQHGYEPEIAYVGEKSIRRAKPMFFKTHRSLTDNGQLFRNEFTLNRVHHTRVRMEPNVARVGQNPE